jgi:hypothetical protein
VQLSIKEIYDRVCPDCKVKIRDLVKERLSEQMITQVIGEVKG